MSLLSILSITLFFVAGSTGLAIGLYNGTHSFFVALGLRIASLLILVPFVLGFMEIVPTDSFAVFSALVLSTIFGGFGIFVFWARLFKQLLINIIRTT